MRIVLRRLRTVNSIRKLNTGVEEHARRTYRTGNVIAHSSQSPFVLHSENCTYIIIIISSDFFALQVIKNN